MDTNTSKDAVTSAAKSADVKATRHEKSKHSKHAHNHGKKLKKPFIIIIAIIIAFCAFMAISHFIVNGDTFLNGSTINGVDVSGMTAEEAKEAVTNEWNSHSITIESNGQAVGTISGFDFTYVIDDEIEEALHPNVFKEAARIIIKSMRKTTFDVVPTEVTANFDAKVKALSIVANDPGTTVSSDAHIDMTNTSFNIIKEVYGDKIDVTLLEDALMKSISKNETTFDYAASDYHKKPSILSDDEELLEKQKYCKKYLNFTITLRCPLATYTLTPADIDSLVTYEEKDGEVTAKVDEDAVETFVKNLAAKYNSYGVTRTLKSVAGYTYTVKGVTYGSSIDTDKEKDALINDLKARKNIDRAAEVKSKVYGTGGENDIGSSYVEISLTNQMLYLVINGNVIVSTPVVTGNTTDCHSTPSGIYYLTYKSRNATLKGKNADGTEYESEVSYWMPFITSSGIGMHDASWRSTFGGSIFRGNGSHGCINMPTNAAATVYNYIQPGMPVIVHW